MKEFVLPGRCLSVALVMKLLYFEMR